MKRSSHLQDKSPSQCSLEVEKRFSHRRYFVNNLDSYHGEYIVKQLAPLLAKNAQLAKPTTQIYSGEDAEPLPQLPPEEPYEIVGTVTEPKPKGIDNVARIIPKSECLEQMLACGTVILDISCDRDELRITMDYLKLLKDLLEKQAVTASAPNPGGDDNDDGGGAGGAGDVAKRRQLILISTVMTWAATKPLDPDNPDIPFIESDFRKRKPHINYKMHFDCENEVIIIARKFRSQIRATVVASGVTYGGKEEVLYWWFQKAWECERLLTILGRGNNIVPIINVKDLAQIVYLLVQECPKKLYILAVEQNVTKQREIIKPLGKIVGSGTFQCIPPEDAFLIPDIDQRIFDLMTLNLALEPTFIVESIELQWTSEGTFEENVPQLMKEFRKTRGLKQFKILIYGPPIVGKTTLAKQLCKEYGLLLVSPETIAQDFEDDLAWRLSHWDRGETAALGLKPEDDVDDDDEDAADDVEDKKNTARITLALLRSGREPTEEEIMGYLRQKLLSHEAQNKGWVLDGFPTTIAKCEALFERGSEEDTVEEEENQIEQFDEDLELYNNVLKKLLPVIVVSLEATDDFICDKAMRQPDGDSRLAEEALLRRLTEFRNGDTRDVTPLNFFDELGIHPLVVPVKDHADYDMKGPYAEVSLKMGRPCRYPKLMAIIEAAESKERKQMDMLRAQEEMALKELELKMQHEREDKMEYWSELYSIMREEEQQALAAAGEPMRNYLVHYIFPTLTPALLEVAKLRPKDPIDYLAEHLFKQNPAGKMLEPGYNLKAEEILGRIKILDEGLKDLSINIDPLMPEEAAPVVPSTSKDVAGSGWMKKTEDRQGWRNLGKTYVQQWTDTG